MVERMDTTPSHSPGFYPGYTSLLRFNGEFIPFIIVILVGVPKRQCHRSFSEVVFLEQARPEHPSCNFQVLFPRTAYMSNLSASVENLWVISSIFRCARLDETRNHGEKRIRNSLITIQEEYKVQKPP